MFFKASFGRGKERRINFLSPERRKGFFLFVFVWLEGSKIGGIYNSTCLPCEEENDWKTINTCFTDYALVKKGLIRLPLHWGNWKENKGKKMDERTNNMFGLLFSIERKGRGHRSRGKGWKWSFSLFQK